MTTADHEAARAAAAAQPIALPYRNWRGVFAVRSIVPIRLLFGANEWHPEPQWLLEAWDADRSAVRTFALSGIGGATLDTATNTTASGWTLADLRAANAARQAEWCPDQQPDLSFRGNELAGEAGEACNVIKKLERERHGWAGSRATLDDLATELADVVICADLAAMAAGVDLYGAVRAKFDATSDKIGLLTKLRTSVADDLHYANGVAGLAMKHRDDAERSLAVAVAAFERIIQCFDLPESVLELASDTLAEIAPPEALRG